MESDKDDASASPKVHGDNEGGVLGKTVKVSIRDRLQAFRCNKSATSSVPKPSTSKIAPKIQHVKYGEGKDSVTVTKDEDIISDGGDGNLAAETFDLPLETIAGKECRLKSITESAVEENPVDVMDLVDFEFKEPPSPPTRNLLVSKTDAVSQENVIRPINREVVHQICSGQVCFESIWKNEF